MEKLTNNISGFFLPRGKGGNTGMLISAMPEIRKKITGLIGRVDPFDQIESGHISDALDWISSGAEIFKIKSPDVPPKHLVSFSVLVDPKENEILLLNHRKALLLLPSGGHLEKNELPFDTAKRELVEELGVEPKPMFDNPDVPAFVSQIETVGLTAGHTDVDLWYVFEGDSKKKINDKSEEFVREFSGYRWLSFDSILSMPINNFDVNMHRFVKKLKVNLL
ncbi:MAG: NUDIX domain-containing protein [Parcubacteria group bacterium]|jgi:8-oxo-dGTP pyrophosphatase MutT (NUDIX family)